MFEKIKKDADWGKIDVCDKILEKYAKLGHYIKHTEVDKISVKEIEDFFKLDEKLGSGYCDIFKKKERKEYVI